MAVNKLLPSARTLRWDADSVRLKNTHEIIMKHFSSGQADILIGTQMISKGLDFPRVTLVGVILAEVGINLPDYPASEKTFQTLTQVAGRSGRSKLGGRVIIQTFTPDHYAIQSASRQDYRGFYDQEIKKRELTGDPPFSRIVRMEYHHVSELSAKNEAFRVAKMLQSWLQEDGNPAVSVVGPAPAYYSRRNGLYRWQILLRGADPAKIIRPHLDQLKSWLVQVDPVSVL
jgi:primosomal protein N' (replication factor Y)